MMTRSALLAALCLAAAGEDTPAPVDLARAATPPQIDGRLDDACWKAAAVIPVDQPNSPGLPRIAPPPATVRYAWDDRYLYIGYETFDDDLVALGSGRREGPADNQRDGCEIWDAKAKVDVVEFFLSLGDERFFWELHHNALNQFNDVFCVVTDPAWPIHRAESNAFGILFLDHEYLEDDGDSTVAMATALKPKADGTPSTIGDGPGDTGYTGELRVPWRSLGAPKDRRDPETHAWRMEGFTLAALTVVQNGDLAQRYHRSGPFGGSPWFHLDAPVWPRYRLVAAVAAP